ncbi:aminotransferase class I/II-fold pyridoxal phosphate-dependent enzyme [Diplocloster hominis]|uniref:trans-sulfuration enzyme family protein n=1 Tax=Diplocloster hominis TaxID=3079010 RepID=UPI0031BAE842
MDQELLILEHLGDEYDKYLQAVVPPVFMNSIHLYPTYEEYQEAASSGKFFYGRVANPTVDVAERKIAALEKGKRALIFSSGMAAAAAAVMATCRAGAHIVCMRDVYQPVKHMLDEFCIRRLDMTVTYVEGTDTQELEDAICERTALIILESPATYVFTVVDLQKIAEIAKKHGVKTYIDNTYCTPLFQNPLVFGIDIVMHTMTKYLGGHSDILGGVLVCDDEQLLKNMQDVRQTFGAIMGPMEAWLVIRGMRTLAVRLKQHQETAMEAAKYLENHPKVKKVYYTGLSSHPQHELIQKQMTGHTGLLSLVVDGPPENALKFVDHLKLFGKGCSWGGFESLAIAPFYYTGQEELDFLRVERGFVRLHCGLEGTANLLADLEGALYAL